MGLLALAAAALVLWPRSRPGERKAPPAVNHAPAPAPQLPAAVPRKGTVVWVAKRARRVYLCRDGRVEREYRAGLAEVVKYGVILDADFFAYLEEHVDAVNAQDSAVLANVVQRCCRLKADVVEADERETSGLRAALIEAVEAATEKSRKLGQR